MLEQDFQADADQYQSAKHFDAPSPKSADPSAEDHARKSDAGGDDSDHQCGDENRCADNGKGKPNGQGIEAGRDGEHDQVPPSGRVRCRTRLFIVKRCKDHLAAYKCQQPKSDPMVEGLNPLMNSPARKPADGRHQRLEQAEMK